jgi:hypothetical protein
MKRATLFLLFLASACDTPQSRFESLQRDFWEKFARQDSFEIALEGRSIRLPLPPSSSQPAERGNLAESLRERAYSIENEKLSAENQSKLAQLRAALDEIRQHPEGGFFDPARCAVAASLRDLRAEQAPIFLEKIPAYYAEVERRWRMPEPRLVAKAVAESQAALDILKTLEKDWSAENRSTLEASRAAIKDFIGLCQSAQLR